MDNVLELRNLSKLYGGKVLANDHISFDLQEGEVHALLGENGAGKSTLMKILYGIEQPDEGSIVLKGQIVNIRNSSDAIRLGIGMVHQELMLIPYLTVAENIILGKEEKNAFGKLNIRKAVNNIKELSDSYNLDVDPNAYVKDLTIGQRQRVEIIKLLYRNANILIFDEPTALLTPQESDALFAVLNRLRNAGKSIIFITHKLREVYQIADRMTVIRHGRVIGTTTPEETDEDELTRMMVGKTVSHVRVLNGSVSNQTTLKVENLVVEDRDGIKPVNNLSFEIHKGEILGVAGIEGNGQTQLAQVLIGLIPIFNGRIVFDGMSLHGKNTKEIRGAGVGCIPDDRQGMGLIVDMHIYDNLILNEFDKKPFARNRFYEDLEAIKDNARKKMKRFSISASGENTLIRELSGGNQQKVVVARELEENLKLLIAAQPTRGVDIASTDYIQMKLIDAARKGCAILLISSDLDELIKISNRIMVMSRGKSVGIVDGNNATREMLGRMMLA